MQVVKFPEDDETEFYIVTEEQPNVSDLFTANARTWEIISIKSTGLLYRGPKSPFQTTGQVVRKRVLTPVDTSHLRNGKNPIDKALR
ncbi:hypothetical protein OM416_19585 [Paenibacillus sp. LS1]|uniref:hypothetical protein n=1 Tax=Paenibacillus sp. LS1 TaxID=2992120 RepID=UPI0022300D97|nr:hypothetical protein [Paenibacillus sp. LS1]MCW3793798.1 hypothetical protein [Paenibacillus sp. LS1]